MRFLFFRSSPAPWLIPALVLLASCATPVERSRDAPPDIPAAERAMRAGQWEQAARQWEQAAAQAPADAARIYRLNAAEAWLAGRNTGPAATLLRRVDPTELPVGTAARYILLNAELALQQGDAERAELYLHPAPPGMDGQLEARYQQAVAQLQRLRSDPADRAVATAASALVEIEDVDPVEGVAILQLLEDVPSRRLEKLAGDATVLGQWAALAVFVRRALIENTEMAAAADAWQAIRPDEPLSRTQFTELYWQYGRLFTPPARIAVLLPTSGSLETTGAAIRDGINVAYLENPANSELVYKPVADEPESALWAYREAVSEGFQWVIGPVRQESVQLIHDFGEGEIASLALNWPETFSKVDAAPRATQYFLSLSQSAEARSVARKMIETGLDRVILLLGNTSWSERAEAAFVDEFTAAGGSIVATERFDAAEADHSIRLTALLRIADSQRRKDELQAGLRLPLAFQPTRRDDFHAFFMAVDAQLGRQLKPQLRFFDAGDKPAYAMSRIFTGVIDPDRDRDLDGVHFPATFGAFGGWKERGVDGLVSLRGGVFGALHALGNDAWNLLPWLGLMRKDPDLQFPGHVGVLSMGRGGRLQRDPVWARFQAGRPAPIMSDVVR